MSELDKRFWNIVLDTWTTAEIHNLAAEEAETYVPSPAVARIRDYGKQS